MKRICLLAALFASLSQQAIADDSVRSFYAGKTMELIVSAGAGAGYDSYARILARHFPRYLPGSPTIIVKQMDGAGGLTATNYLAGVAPKDGSVFATVNNPIPYLPLLGETKARYDSKTLNWIGSMASEVGLLVSTRASGVDSIEKAISTGMTVAATGAGSGSYFNARVLNRFIGTKLKIVAGYQTATQGLLAMERGEVDGFPALMWSTLNHTKPDWLVGDKIYILGQLALKPHPKLPNVPLVSQFVANEADRQALQVAFAPLAAARPFVAPPNVPIERVNALRAAFMATLDDADFRKDLERERLETFGSMSGEELTELIAQVYKTPADVLANVAALSKD